MAAANDPPPNNIWDSLDALQDHPLLYTARENVNQQPVQSCTDEAGHDREDVVPLVKPPTMTQDEFMEHKQSALSKCQVSNVVFCDKVRNPQDWLQAVRRHLRSIDLQEPRDCYGRGHPPLPARKLQPRRNLHETC
jgi:hypothetical protein